MKNRKQNQRVDEDGEAILSRRNKVDRQRLEHMLAVIVRNPVAHTSVRDMLKPGLLTDIEPAWGVIWSVVRKYFRRHNALPGRSELLALIHQRVSDNSELLAQEELHKVDDFLAYAYSKKVHTTDIATDGEHQLTATTTCQDFLNEKLAHEMQDQMTRNDTVPDNMPKVLNEFAQRSQVIASLSVPNIGPVFKPGWDKRVVIKTTKTRSEVLDTLLDGGDAPGEVYLLMAPYGAYKTTLAVQLCLERAMVCCELFLSGSLAPGVKPCVIFASAEMTELEFQQRCLVYAAQIPRKRLKQIVDISSFATTRRPGVTPETQYERELFKEEGSYLNERQRVDSLINLVNEYVHFIEFTDSNKENPHAGAGGMQELANIVAGLAQKHKGMQPLGFYIDHLAAMVDRMMSTGQYTERDQQRFLKQGPFEAGNWLGKRYGAPVWVFHQLSGAANEKRPTVDIRHTEADQCKSVATYADFVFTGGSVSEDEDQLCRIRCTKHRRSPYATAAICRLNGEFGRLQLSDKRYVVRGDKFILDDGVEEAKQKNGGDNYEANKREIARLRQEKSSRQVNG